MNLRSDAPPIVASAPPTLVIECLTPAVDCGRFSAKRLAGDVVRVGADIFRDGHDILAAQVLYRGPADDEWRSVPMAFEFDDDRWYGEFAVDQAGGWRFTVEAWIDAFATWRGELKKKHDARQDVASELLEGAELVHGASRHARGGDRTALDSAAALLRRAAAPQAERVVAGAAAPLLELMARYGPRPGLTRAPAPLPLWVDRPRAGFAAWYEMFPRSFPGAAGGHGTFRTAAAALDRVAGLGFDVVYLPPIHPIGHTHRKGPNNTLLAGPSDPGSPWAIGDSAGGHMAVAPELGTLEDFRFFRERAEALGMEVALDYALQCSPDHPWVREHPEWFFVRPDGSIKYAENPPKKYEDILPINFWCDDRAGLWHACRDVLRFWIGEGVRTFRVDNPHTKPFSFWEWVIGEIHGEHPDVVFLSEAFTRPKRMKRLAKLGFSQSYTYFTWRNSASELESYITELTATPMREYYRGNLFANTPDILHEYLQQGGPPAFRIRLLLAATLLPIYGIYSGFELFEAEPLRVGSEEYLHSEKYQVRPRDFSGPSLDEDLMRLNRLRREHPALQRYDNIQFLPTGDEHVLCYRKVAGEDDLLVLVNVDPAAPHTAAVDLGEAMDATDLATGVSERLDATPWEVTLDPSAEPGRIWRLATLGAPGGEA